MLCWQVADLIIDILTYELYLKEIDEYLRYAPNNELLSNKNLQITNMDFQILNLEGDKLIMKKFNNGFYNEPKKKTSTIDWDKYTDFNDSKRALDPVEYIREMREDDRMVERGSRV